MIQQILHVCIFFWRIIFAMTSHKQIIWSLFREGWGAGVHKHDPRAGGVVQIPIAIARHMLYCIIYCMSSLRGLPAIWRCSRRPSGTSGQQAYHQDQYFFLDISASFTNNAMFFLWFSKVPMIRNQTTIKPGDNMGTKSIGNLFEVLPDLFLFTAHVQLFP